MLDLNQVIDFNNTVLQTVRAVIHELSGVELLKIPDSCSTNAIQLFSYALNTSVITLEQYSDYFDITEGDDLHLVAVRLGQQLGSAYNALAGAAKRKYGEGACITDLFSDRLKTAVGFSDALELELDSAPHGWAAYNFYFGAAARPK